MQKVPCLGTTEKHGVLGLTISGPAPTARTMAWDLNSHQPSPACIGHRAAARRLLMGAARSQRRARRDLLLR